MKLLMITQRQPSFLPLFPVDIFRSHTVFFHGNAIIYRANQLAKIAAHAFFVDHSIGVVRLTIFQFDGLVRGVFTSNITETAMDTFILVYFGDMMIVDIEVFPVRDGRD